MNSLTEGYWTIFTYYQALRPELTDILSDADLAFSPGGANPTLGALCREMGEVQHGYIQSFKTFELKSFDYRHPDPTIENSVERLTAWYTDLDNELKATIAGLSEDDVQNRRIDRGAGFTLPVQGQLDAYKEALLIFYSKVNVYLKAMPRTLPGQWREWLW